MAIGSKGKKSKEKTSSSKKSKKKGSKKGKKDAIWRSIAQICETQDGDKLYVRANDYKGYLIWAEYPEVDEDNQPVGEPTYYRVLSANIFDPHEKAPDFVKHQIVINLANEKSAVDVAAAESDEEDDE